MTVSESNILSGFDRLNGLMQWWGLSGPVEQGGFEVQTKRHQVLITELNNIASETSNYQFETLRTTSDQIALLLQELLRARAPQEMLAAQSDIVAGLLESLVVQTKVWAELTQKMHDCFNAVAGEIAEEIQERSGTTVQSEPQSAPAKQTSQETVKRAA